MTERSIESSEQCSAARDINPNERAGDLTVDAMRNFVPMPDLF